MTRYLTLVLKRGILFFFFFFFFLFLFFRPEGGRKDAERRKDIKGQGGQDKKRGTRASFPVKGRHWAHSQGSVTVLLIEREGDAKLKLASTQHDIARTGQEQQQGGPHQQQRYITDTPHEGQCHFEQLDGFPWMQDARC